MAQDRNEDGTFKSPADRRKQEDEARADDMRDAVEKERPWKQEAKARKAKTVEVSDGAEKEAWEESLEKPGMSEQAGADRLTEILQAADDADAEIPEGLDEEALQAARERLEESGDIEAAQDALEQMLQGEEAAEAEAEQPPESVALDALAEEMGVDDLSAITTTVKVDGEEQEVSLEDLRDGHMRQRAFTRKTQELAEQRKQVEQTAETYASRLEEVAYLQQKLGNVLTPEQAQALSAEYEAVRQQLTEASRPDPSTLEEERGKLREAFGWEDESEWEEATETLADFAVEGYGYTPSDLENTFDHRLFQMLEESRRYRQLKKQGRDTIEQARKGQPRKTLKPGTTTKKSRDPGSDALKRHRKERTADSAAAAILDAGLLGGS